MPTQAGRAAWRKNKKLTPDPLRKLLRRLQLLLELTIGDEGAWVLGRRFSDSPTCSRGVEGLFKTEAGQERPVLRAFVLVPAS